MMDASRQNATEANSTGVSMYLSFDSSMSSAVFRTLEGTSNDNSMRSDVGNDAVDNSLESGHQDSTLEARDYSHLSYLQNVKQLEETISPLRAFPSNILQENNGACSTPAKDGPLTVRNIKNELKPNEKQQLQPLREEKENAKSIVEVLPKEEDKENALPMTGVIGTVVTMSTGDMVKKDNMQEACKHQLPKDIKNTLPITEVIVKMATLTTVDVVVTDIVQEEGQQQLSTIEEQSESVNEKLSTSNNEEQAVGGDATQKTTVQDEIEIESIDKNAEVNTKRIPIKKKTSRKSVAEPNLPANRPSRIAVKRDSLTNVSSSKSKVQKNSSKTSTKQSSSAKLSKTPTPASVSRIRLSQTASTTTRKGRASMLPTTQSDKRQFASTRRMSVMVNTTLNSPARKLTRKTQSTKSDMTSKQQPERRSVLPSSKAAHVIPRFDQLSPKSQHEIISAHMQPYTNEKEPFQLPPVASSAKSIGIISSAQKSNEPMFSCMTCGAKFRIKSLLDAHKRSHEEGVPSFVRRPPASSGTSATTSSLHGAMNKCKFCDKKFALLRTLHIHLMQNCPKIPPNEKRKLEFTEMDHVEKAQLPTFFHQNHQAAAGVAASNPGKAENHLYHLQALRSHSNLSYSSTESGNDKVLADVTMIANQVSAAVNGNTGQMAPPSVNKVKKSTAHSGIYRTPNKSIPCTSCKMEFKNVLEHIQHNMTVHFKVPPNIAAMDNA